MSRLADHEKLTAFIDGELDLPDQLEMERRHAAEPALRRLVDDARELKAATKEASRHAAPDSLRRRLAARAAPAPPLASSTLSAVVQAAGRWFDWQPMVASLGVAAAAAFLVGSSWKQSVARQQLEDDVVASHVRSTLGQHLVDVSSSDHHQVKPFLSARLGFSPPVTEPAIAGSEFLGGRIDYLDGRPVAALVYKQGPHVVNSFIWPTRGADAMPAFSQERGFLTAHWADRGMAHWVISDVNAQEFQALVQAIRQGDAQR
jgi:anti-sigma factor RsiW